MADLDVAEAAGGLAAIPWTWTAGGDDAALAAAGWEFTEAKGDRRSFRRGGLELDSYRTGDKVDQYEVTVVLTWPDPDDRTDDELDREYAARWQWASVAAATVLGAPAFSGQYGTAGFPEEQDAMWASVWALPGDGWIMVTQTHEDPDLPYRINLVCAPTR